VGRGASQRLVRTRVRDGVGWAALGALTFVAFSLGSFWFADSWLQPAMLAAMAIALLAGLLVGDRRAIRAGRPRGAEAVRYGLLLAMLFAAAVGLVLLAWTALFVTLLGGWVS
jgi:hypothetical protein